MNFIRQEDIKLAEYLPAFIVKDEEINNYPKYLSVDRIDQHGAQEHWT